MSEPTQWFGKLLSSKPADTKKAVLISIMGGKAYKLMHNLISPVKPKDKSFEQLVEIMRSLPPLDIVQHYRFNSTVHQDGESVAVLYIRG